MTSSNGNIFRVTGPLCGEFTGPRWIPRTKTSEAELWCLLWWVNNREAGDLRRYRAHYDVTVMIMWSLIMFQTFYNQSFHHGSISIRMGLLPDECSYLLISRYEQWKCGVVAATISLKGSYFPLPSHSVLSDNIFCRWNKITVIIGLTIILVICYF